jgi:hypothetical protein
VIVPFTNCSTTFTLLASFGFKKMSPPIMVTLSQTAYRVTIS